MNVLTFDIEDWFHVLDNPYTKYDYQWEKFESRIHRNMDLIFELLLTRNLKATFFCVGWIGEKYPDIVKKIVNYGFEVASHTNRHQLVYEQSQKEFDHDLRCSVETLENLTGQKIRAFRAPGFSITEECLWAFESLLNQGIEIDCSVFPASRAHGGIKGFLKDDPVILKYNGSLIKEFPINTAAFLGKKIIFSGGGYFRLIPLPFLKGLFRNSEYTMTYFHPRDFDHLQPMIPGLSLSRKFKSYYGLESTKRKLENILDGFQFIDLKTADNQIDWSVKEKINIK